MSNPHLRNWAVRNQGKMPQDDPKSEKHSSDLDIGDASEGVDRSGAVVDQPGASGNRANGTAGGSGSIGGTGSISEDQPKA